MVRICVSHWDRRRKCCQWFAAGCAERQVRFGPDGGPVSEPVGEPDWEPDLELNNVLLDQFLAVVSEPNTHFLAVLEPDNGSAVLGQSKACLVFLERRVRHRLRIPQSQNPCPLCLFSRTASVLDSETRLLVLLLLWLHYSGFLLGHAQPQACREKR